MPKRFTDTGKWDKPWFRMLPPKFKCLWDYLYTRCNHIGIWDVDMETANHFIRAKITLHEAKTAFAGRFKEIENGKKWFLPGFVPFQYGELTANNNFHKSLIAALGRLRLDVDPIEKSGAGEGLTSPLVGDIDKDKDKYKEKKEEGVAGETKRLWLDFVYLTPSEHSKLVDLMGQHLPPFIKRLNGYVGQIGEKKASARYKSHYHVILNWYQKDIDEGKIRPSSAIGSPKPSVISMDVIERMTNPDAKAAALRLRNEQLKEASK